MNKPRHISIFFAAVGLLCTAGGLAGCDNGRPSATEAFNRADYYVGGPDQTEASRAAFIADIDAADTSIDVAVSTLDDTDVARALVAADQRGVEVRVVSDCDQAWHSLDADDPAKQTFGQYVIDRCRQSWANATSQTPEATDEGLKILEDAGIEPSYGDGEITYLPEPTLASVLGTCQTDEAAQFKVCSQGQGGGQGQMVRPGDYNTMSHDFAVIDDLLVWNFSAFDDTRHSFVGWRIESSLLAYDFGSEFQQMYGGTYATTLDVYNGPLKSSTDYNVRYLTDKGRMDVWFNPQERLLKTVIDEIYKAHASVWVMTDNLANLDVIDALQYKADNGFDVRVMTHPDHQAAGDAAAGVDALGGRDAPDGVDHLPTLIVIDELADRNGRIRPRQVLALSHPLMRASPFETEADTPADRVLIFPSDLFTDGNLWMLQESGNTNHNYALISRFVAHWTDRWQAAQP